MMRPMTPLDAQKLQTQALLANNPQLAAIYQQQLKALAAQRAAVMNATGQTSGTLAQNVSQQQSPQNSPNLAARMLQQQLNRPMMNVRPVARPPVTADTIKAALLRYHMQMKKIEEALPLQTDPAKQQQLLAFKEKLSNDWKTALMALQNQQKQTPGSPSISASNLASPNPVLLAGTANNASAILNKIAQATVNPNPVASPMNSILLFIHIIVPRPTPNTPQTSATQLHLPSGMAIFPNAPQSSVKVFSDRDFLPSQSHNKRPAQESIALVAEPRKTRRLPTLLEELGISGVEPEVSQVF
jgi:hypothetical protein